MGAERNYHEDGLPPNVLKALKSVVSTFDSQKIKEKKGRDKNKNERHDSRRNQLPNYKFDDDDEDDDEGDSIGTSDSFDDDDGDDSLIPVEPIEDDKLDSGVMERLATSWREAINETLEYR